MRSFLRNRSKHVVSLALVSALAGACVQQDAPSVAIKPLNADIVFGVEPIEEELASPANFTPEEVTVDTSSAAIRDDAPPLPPQDFPPPTVKNVPDFGFSAPK
jgi:hypothetical protein